MATLELAPDVASLVDRTIRIPDALLFDVSADGSTALFASNLSGSYQLWALPTRGGGITQVSHGMERVIWARIAHDGRRVAFSRDFQGREEHQIFLTDLSGAPEQQLSRFDHVRAFDFAWSPDDAFLALAGTTRESNYLWLVDVASGELRPRYRPRHFVFSPTWFAHTQFLACVARTTDDPRAMEIVLLEGDREAVIFTPRAGAQNAAPEWHPRERKLLFKTDAPGHWALAVLDVDRGHVEYVQAGPELGLDFPDYRWLVGGSRILFTAAREGRTYLYHVADAHGTPELMPTPPGRIGNLEPTRDGSALILSWSGLSTPPQIARMDLRTKEFTTIHAPARHLEQALGQAEFVTYSSWDGRQIPTFLVRSPRDGAAPWVIWVHGGPTWEVADEWNPAIQAIAGAGFNVCCPNYRGSTGYGPEFQHLILRDPGGGEFRDVIHATYYLLGQGIAQPGRVALVGASYGGFMTFLGLTKAPDLWAAGAAIVGITDWRAMYDLADAAFRSFVEELLGKPDDDPFLFADRSPIHFVENLQAPLLIWHRANDSRCPLQPVQRFVQRLQELGRSHEFHVMADEGHGYQKVDNLVQQYQHVVAFLHRHLRP